jgi:PKD repeat protein
MECLRERRRALAYQWDFGDGTTAAGARASHRYHVAKEYSVTLVVTDGVTRSTPAALHVRVAPPPKPGAPKHS